MEKERKNRIGDEVMTIISVDAKEKILKTLGRGFYFGTEIPGPGFFYLDGEDIGLMNIESTKIKLKETGDIVYGAVVHWLFIEEWEKSGWGNTLNPVFVSYDEFIKTQKKQQP